MKEQFAILPELPIVGTLKLSTREGISLSSINVVKKTKPSELNPFFRHCFEEIQNYLGGKDPKWTIKLDFSELSDFQMSVLKEMKKIPYGKVASYKAIGSACGNNPFLLIYPCHRVIGSKSLGGFAHGLEMKQKLIDLEIN
jgi:methylated-DNA-[protein]-cysteine S-methyltransferase